MPPSTRPARPRPPRPHGVPSPATRPGMRRWLPLSVFVLVAVVLLTVGTVPWWVVPAYTVMSTLTFVVYAADKRSAVHGRRRVPERTLHRLALLGGWPGAAVAQQLLRHKTIKQGFRRTYRWTVVLHVVVVALVVVVAHLT